MEQRTHDITWLSYTDEDKTDICQYEGVAEPAIELCKFLQDNKNVWSYITFKLQRAIQQTSAPNIAIYLDVLHMDRTKDLCKPVWRSIVRYTPMI